MKWLGLIFLVGLLMTGCSGSKETMKKADQTEKQSGAKLKGEKENGKKEYKLIVFDPSFETWYQTHWSEATDHSKSYYHSWNEQYVTAWNYKATHTGYASYFGNTIDYNFNTDYGLKVERKLYYYFRWVETQLGIQILDYKRPNNIFN